MARLEVTEVETGVNSMEKSVCSEADGISEQREIKVCRGVYFQLACIFAQEPRLCRNAIVQGFALCLGQLSAETHGLFIKTF